MWALFWRLYAAHIFADYPLQTRFILAKKGKFSGLLLHSTIVFATALVSLYPAIWYRPQLAFCALAISIAHFFLDLLKNKSGKTNSRLGTVNYLADQLGHFGIILLCATIFGYGHFYGQAEQFMRLAAIFFAIWGLPITLYFFRSAIKGTEISIFTEPFARYALLERTLIFLALNAANAYILVGGLVFAVVIRALLYFNEENVPLPFAEWLITAVIALVARYFATPLHFFGF